MMIKPHLNSQIPWEILKNLYTEYKNYIRFPSSKCGKIHISKRKHELQIKNRKYIVENMICRKNCKIDQIVKISKHPHKKRLALKNFKELYNESTKTTQKQIEIFFEKFLQCQQKQVDQMTKNIKNLPPLKGKYLTEKYLNLKMCEFLENKFSKSFQRKIAYTIFTKFNIDKHILINIIDDYMPFHTQFKTDTCLNNMKNKHIYSLLMSRNVNDLKLILQYNDQNKDGFNIKNFFENYYYRWEKLLFGQDDWVEALAARLFNFYVYLNIIICSGKINKKNQYGQFDHYHDWTSLWSINEMYDADSFMFIPYLQICLNLDYFNDKETKKQGNFSAINMFKHDKIKYLLDEIFNYLCNLQFLKNHFLQKQNKPLENIIRFKISDSGELNTILRI